MNTRYFSKVKDKPRLTTDQKRAARRVLELKRIYHLQYPNGLPHNGLGVKYVKYLLRTMAFLPDDQREKWLSRYGQWIDPATRSYLLSLGPYWYAQRSLGDHLELADADREAAMAWSIEASGVTKEEREVINREKDRLWQERRRRRNGAKPQARSLSRTQPWLADGISRSAWERRRRKANAASSSLPSLYIRKPDEVAASHDTASPPAPRQPRGSSRIAGITIPLPENNPLVILLGAALERGDEVGPLMAYIPELYKGASTRPSFCTTKLSPH
jgi:hypothetical protein